MKVFIRTTALLTLSLSAVAAFAHHSAAPFNFGDPVVIDVIWTPSFARRGAFALAAEAAGYSFGSLLSRILYEAATRYTGGPFLLPARRLSCQRLIVLFSALLLSTFLLLTALSR